MTHDKIERKFPSYFKNFSLPEGVKEESIKVYRACESLKVDKDSFLPSYEKNNFQISNEDKTDPGQYSLSTFEKARDVGRFAALDGRFQPPWKIAKGETETCCGLVQRTKERKKSSRRSSHVDWWLYECSIPYEHFELIEDFNTYLANL